MAVRGKRLFTSEAVTMGHPDKVADQISDAVLDAILKEDPYGRVACETLVKSNMAVLAGEITTKARIDFPSVVRETIREIGYDSGDTGFDWHTAAILVCVEQQSPDIAQGVDEGREKDLGAGDQGLMFGYACRETAHLMPAAIDLARGIVNRLAETRAKRELTYLRPDGKSQVTVEYDGDRLVRVHTVVVSTQHSPDVPHTRIKHDVIEQIVKPVIPPELLDRHTIFHINPTGRFVMGGPQADAGLTGRKIICDTYGGAGHHGGGAFSGKDPTKVDRSAAYAARHAAKNIVAAGLADRCEIQLSYAIGVSHPISVAVDTYGTGTVPDEKIATLVKDRFDFTPSGIIKRLKLRRPIYKQTARWGHFGLDRPDYAWEVLDEAEGLRKAAGLAEAKPAKRKAVVSR